MHVRQRIECAELVADGKARAPRHPHAHGLAGFAIGGFFALDLEARIERAALRIAASRARVSGVSSAMIRITKLSSRAITPVARSRHWPCVSQ